MTENNGRTRADEPVGPSLANVDGKPDTYVAWNGETYQGAPPNDWHLASDGRWWSPGTDPIQSSKHSGTSILASTPQPPRTPPPPRVPPPPQDKNTPWWRKTWGAVLLVVVGLLIVSNLARAGRNISESQEQTDAIDAVSESAIREFQQEASTLNEAVEFWPVNVIREMAVPVCSVASDSNGFDDFGQTMADIWVQIQSDTKQSYDNNVNNFVELQRLLLKLFCPDALS